MIRHNGKIILGVDLGNYNIKTEHVCFPSAFVELAGDGNNYSHTLRYNGRYYALGGKRVAQRDDKASMNDDFLILTQFAIARELNANGIGPGSCEIYLATALPTRRCAQGSSSFSADRWSSFTTGSGTG